MAAIFLFEQIDIFPIINYDVFIVSLSIFEAKIGHQLYISPNPRSAFIA